MKEAIKGLPEGALAGMIVMLLLLIFGIISIAIDATRHDSPREPATASPSEDLRYLTCDSSYLDIKNEPVDNLRLIRDTGLLYARSATNVYEVSINRCFLSSEVVE